MLREYLGGALKKKGDIKNDTQIIWIYYTQMLREYLGAPKEKRHKNEIQIIYLNLFYTNASWIFRAP